MKLLKAVTNYVNYRRVLGEKYSASERHLKHFARIVGENANISDVQPKIVDKFLRGNGPLTATWFIKYRTLRDLYRYLISRGLAKKPPLPVDIPKYTPAFVPYIYTEKELRLLLDAS